MRRSLWFVGLAAAAIASCGEESPPEPQAVMFFSLTAAPNGTCIVNEPFELPEDSGAREAALNGLGPGEADRLVNGEARVECTVAARDDGRFDLAFRLQSGVIANFQGSGIVDSNGGEVSVSFSHSAGSVIQSDCSATVGTILDGAIHIPEILCDDMIDRRQEGTHCSARGALIFENCVK